MKSKAYRRYERLLFAVCGLAGLLYGIDMGFGGDTPCQVPVNAGLDAL